MEHHGGTTSLRSAAPHWSLDGDKKLLELLQNIHEKVVNKCKETNSMFDQMITSLDEANIDVQSVNNRFMSLSNSQFVESRVYGDDADLTTQPAPGKQSPQPATPTSEVSRVKSSLLLLESHHEVLEIFPDTDSDSDDEHLTSVVLKPKNVYSERPLPYIIGTANWRNKWHSGTVPSDSESSSVRSRSQISQYSESESEPGTQPTNWPAQDDTLSSGSLSPANAPAPAPAPPAAPSLIASELARRLGNIPQTPQPSSVYEQPKMDTTKIYKPEAPVTATIFSEEPPPLPQISDTESDQSEDDNDIFAEIHKTSKRSGFGGSMVAGDLFNYDVKGLTKPAANQKSTLTQEESEPESFTSKPQTTVPKDSTENTVKKPIGGISLFGSNRGTESIGAAILKRNQRKSSSDEDTASDSKPVIKSKPKSKKSVKNETANKVEKDIFDDLFAKSKINNKSDDRKVMESVKTVIEVNKKGDLFKDDIFDDIDDIFTSNIVSSLPKKEPKKQKSIFEDDDQLFSEVAITKAPKIETSSKSSVSSKNKGLFDSDDELFSDKIMIDTNKMNKTTNKANKDVKKTITSNSQPKESSIFDDSSDDGLFLDVKIKKPPQSVDTKKVSESIDKETPQTTTKPTLSQLNTKSSYETEPRNELVTKEKQVSPNFTNVLKNEVKHVPFQSPSIFDDEANDIFSNTQKSETPNAEINDDQNKNNTESLMFDITNIDEKFIDKLQTNLIEEDDSFTDENKKFDNNVITNNTKYEIDIDKYFSNNREQENINDSIEDLVKNERVINTETEITKEDPVDDVSAQHDLDDVDLQKSVDLEIQEKKKLELEKSLEESLLKHNELDKQVEIFADEPPVFEKPTEPKKSKNVNALFDDDSDDEALFFKKEDPIIDEKPQLFEPNTKPNLFGIFLDEPPDFDFTQKEEKVTKATDTQHTENLFNAPLEDYQSEDKETLNETKLDTKKISKLKVNLNINVNTLLPGASPKKTPKSSNENTNTQTEKPNDKIAANINETRDTNTEANEIDTTETDGQTISTAPLPKSVSFDKNPESNVLDNQLSKQRAKIQVKRRPSSRRARHEAVRKSIRDIQDESNDSTDNSSSIDDHKAKSYENDDQKTESNKIEDKKGKEENIKVDDHKSKRYDIDIGSPQSEVEDILISRGTPKDKNISEITNESNITAKNETDLEITKDSQVREHIVVSETKQKDVKSKIVYILNDEDIFNTDNSNLAKSNDKQTDEQILTTKQSEQKSNILTIIDDDPLFKSDKTIDAQPTTTKPKTITKPAKTSLFDDSSDDDALFKPKAQSKKPVTIFGSDSDEDIFFGKKTETKTSVVERKKETVVKKALFSDDEDDDDLFGAKKKTAPKSSQAIASTSTARSRNAPTVDDPLTNLENDYTF